MSTERMLFLYTLAATVPIAVLTATLLMTRLSGRALLALTAIGGFISFGAFCHLMFELLYELAGAPTSKIPVWTVFYLVTYLITAFTFLFFGLHVVDPGLYFGGFGATNKAAFVDALYLSLSDYIGSTPDPTLKFKNQLARFLPVIQGILSMFVNVVVIAKFVSGF